MARIADLRALGLRFRNEDPDGNPIELFASAQDLERQAGSAGRRGRRHDDRSRPRHGLKFSVVYWTGDSGGHAMRNCFCDGVYGSGIWTAGVKADFDFCNNVFANGNYAWTYQGGASALADAGGRGGRQGSPPPAAAPTELIHYKVIYSYFANNRSIAGSETGARLEYRARTLCGCRIPVHARWQVRTHKR